MALQPPCSVIQSEHAWILISILDDLIGPFRLFSGVILVCGDFSRLSVRFEVGLLISIVGRGL